MMRAQGHHLESWQFCCLMNRLGILLLSSYHPFAGVGGVGIAHGAAGWTWSNDSVYVRGGLGDASGESVKEKIAPQLSGRVSATQLRSQASSVQQ